MRTLGTILLNVSLVISAGRASAQDMTAVCADRCMLRVNNDKVQVSEVTLKPGERLPQHTHPAHVAYVIQGGIVRVAYLGGTAHEVVLRPGETLWSEPEGPHTTTNVGNSVVRYLVVELKSTTRATPAPPQ